MAGLHGWIARAAPPGTGVLPLVLPSPAGAFAAAGASLASRDKNNDLHHEGVPVQIPLAWMLPGLAALAACAVAIALFRRRTRVEVLPQVLRLAAEIESVARTVEEDLAGMPRHAFSSFSLACGEYSRRARKALDAGLGLQARPRVVLTSTLLLLHEDHRKIVDLRSQLDRALGRWSKAEAGPPVFRFERSGGSRWPGSSSPRPSGFV